MREDYIQCQTPHWLRRRQSCRRLRCANQRCFSVHWCMLNSATDLKHCTRADRGGHLHSARCSWSWSLHLPASDDSEFALQYQLSRDTIKKWCSVGDQDQKPGLQYGFGDEGLTTILKVIIVKWLFIWHLNCREIACLFHSLSVVYNHWLLSGLN